MYSVNMKVLLALKNHVTWFTVSETYIHLDFKKYNSLFTLLFFRYVRAEVLAGFVNGLFLIFTAFFIFSEGVEV